MKRHLTLLTLLFLTASSTGLVIVNVRLRADNQRLGVQVAVLTNRVAVLDRYRPTDEAIRKGIDHEFEGIDANRVHRTVDW
jgi:hypothetical protein